MTDKEMFDHISAELRYIRKRLDDHIDSSRIRAEADAKVIGALKTRVATISAGIALVVSSLVAWWVKGMDA